MKADSEHERRQTEKPVLFDRNQEQESGDDRLVSVDTHLSLSRTSHAEGGEAPESAITPSKQMGGHQVWQHNEWIRSKHLQSESVLLILHGDSPNCSPCSRSCHVYQKQHVRI